MAPKDYSKTRDEEAERTRAELWIIVAIVVVVIAGALIFRIVKHKPATPAVRIVPAGAPANAVVATPASVTPRPAPPPQAAQ